MSLIRKVLYQIENPICAAFATVGIIVSIFALSFLVFTFGYWIITIILAGFFNFYLPFSWWYSLGAWLIWLIIWPKNYSFIS